MNEITPGLQALNDELADELVSETKDVMIDYLQLAITDIFEDHLLSEIPVVKTIAAICKTGLAIRDRYFAKKLLAFLFEFHKGEYDESKRNKFVDEMNDQGYRNKVVETVTVFIDRYTELTKSIILSRLLISYINGRFDWSKFVFYSNCTDLLFIHDLKILEALYLDREKNISEQSEIVLQHKSSLNRLEHLGFVLTDIFQSFTAGQTPVHVKYYIAPDGIEFYESIYSLSFLNKIASGERSFT